MAITKCCRSSKRSTAVVSARSGAMSPAPLGPRSDALYYAQRGETDPDPDPIGGNLLTELSVELIFPTPFAAESRSVRTFLFADAGNIFETKRDDIDADFAVQDLRASVGIGLSWLTAIGRAQLQPGQGDQQRVRRRYRSVPVLSGANVLIAIG